MKPCVVPERMQTLRSEVFNLWKKKPNGNCSCSPSELQQILEVHDFAVFAGLPRSREMKLTSAKLFG